MIIRLFLFVIVGVLALGVPIVGTYYVVRPLLQAYRARLYGRVNANMTCLLSTCSESVNPNSADSIYEDGHWMHRRCRKQLLE